VPEQTSKLKWVSVYLALCVLPLFVFFMPILPAFTAHKSVTSLFIYIPDLCLLLTALLGWQIKQTRIFWAALSVLGLYHYLLHPSSLTPTDNARLVAFPILTVGLPLYFSILFTIKESKLASDHTVSRLLLAFFPLILLLALYAWAPDIPPKILYWSVLSNKASGWPEFCALSFALLGLVAYKLDDPKIKSFLTAFLIGMVPLYLGLYVGLVPNPLRSQAEISFHIIFSYSLLSIVFLHAILHMYWRRVYQDALTTIPNRQALDDHLHTLAGHFVLAMVDIDHFKKFNDSYGHAEGDNVLRMVAQHLQSHLGQKVYRYGGEEFCVVFEEAGLKEAEKMMDEARAQLEKRDFVIRTHRRRTGEEKEGKGKDMLDSKVRITISVGVAQADKKAAHFHEVIKNADQALYKAKSKGRNRVVVN